MGRSDRRGLLGLGTAHRPPERRRSATLRDLGRFLAHPIDHHALVYPAHPAAEPSRVVVAERTVLHLRDHRHGAAQGFDLPLGGVEIALGQSAANGELEERGTTRDEITYCRVPLLEAQVARIHPVRSHRDERLAGELLVSREGLHRGGLTGGVPVEGVDDLAAPELVVHQQPTQEREVLVTESGTARGDRRLDSRQVHGHDVGVALDDDGLMPLGDVLLRQVEAEQHLRLLVQQRLRGVDILSRHRVVVEDLACAEADDVTGQVADGPQQSTVEPVHRTPLALAGQPGRLEFLELEALVQQMLGERVPPTRGEPAPELLCRGGIEVALRQVVPRRLRLG